MTAKKAIALLLSAVCFLCVCGCKAPVNKDSYSSHQQTVSYWYYNHLNGNQKVIYNKVQKAVNNMETGLIELGNYERQDVFLAARSVLSDRADFFWMPESYVISENESGIICVGFEYSDNDISSSYLIPAGQKQSASSKLSSVIAEINQGISADMSDFDKELYFHNWLCDNVDYAQSTDDKTVYTAYGALVNKTAVCEGYARAMQLLCNLNGIDCHIVYGSAAVNGSEYIGHMWNQIKLDQKYYNLDVTLDDASNTVYDYFNVTDKQLTKTHAFDRDFSLLTQAEKADGNVSFNYCLPACTAQAYNYYNVYKSIEKDE